MEVSYFINNLEVHRPLNYAELSIELNYDTDDQFSQAITLTEFEWGLGAQVQSGLADAVVLIEAHKNGGLTGGVGIFEGLPFRIELIHDNKTRELFNGYLNTSTASYDCDKIVLSSVEKGKVDWFRENADSQTFEGMFDEGFFDRSEFIPMPYVLSSIPDNKEALLALLSVAFLVTTIATQLQLLDEYIAKLPNAVFDFLTAVALGLRIVYIIGLVITLAILIKRIINLLIQPVKYHDIMNVQRLCQIGADYFGMTFTSSILDSDPYNRMVILPQKYSAGTSNINNDDGTIDVILGFIDAASTGRKGFPIGTFGDLLRALKTKWNAKLIMNGNNITLEREDFNNSAENYITPAVDQTTFRLNASDYKANYTVEYQRDFNDKQSVNKYEGNLTQAIRTPVVVTNSDMLLMTGLEQRLIPYARAVRKEDFTTPEKILRTLATLFDPVVEGITTVLNAVVDVLNALLNALGIKPIAAIDYTSVVDQIDNRIGVLHMENDFVDVPKMFLIDEDTDPTLNKISVDNTDFINSEYLYNNYHFIRSFVVSNDNPNGNQFKIHELTNVPFCFDDYELLRNDNRLQDDLNRGGKLISAKWNVEGGIVDLEFGIDGAYTNNIEEKIITPDGK